MSPAVLERRFANRLEDLNEVMHELGRFLEAERIGPRSAYAATLAAEELATNIVKYGYDDRTVHEILLRVEVDCSAIRLILEDDGHPFNPFNFPPPNLHLPIEDRAPGGLGIHLVRKLADRCDYQRVNARNRVTVEIALNGFAEGEKCE